MKKQSKLYFFLILTFIALNLGLGSWGLTEPSEARYAEIGREMFESGDYLHPRLLGIKHYHKPPITYYVTALGYKLFGVNEFGARFFLSVSLILQLWFVYQIAKLLFESERIAFASSIIYFSFPLALIAARVLTTDSFLLTFIVWSIYLLIRYFKSRKLLFLYAFYVVLGIGFLTKGPAVLIPVGSFFLFWKIIRKEAFEISIHTILGGFLFLLISSSWFFAIVLDDPKFLDYFINEQLVKRTLSAQNLHRAKPFWYYFLFAPLVGFPWLPFILLNSIVNYKNSLKNKDVPMILVATIGSIFLFYSVVSSKLILYILPIFPFLAILGGFLMFKASSKINRFHSWVYIALCLSICIFLIAGNFMDQIKLALALSLVLAGVILLGLVVIHKKIKDDRMRLLYLSVLFSFGVILCLPVFGSQNEKSIGSLKDVIVFIENKKGHAIDNLMIYNLMLSSPSFYLQDKVVTIKGNPSRVVRETQFESDSIFKRNLIDITAPDQSTELAELLAKKNNVFLMKKNDSLPDWIKKTLDCSKQKAQIEKYVVYY